MITDRKKLRSVLIEKGIKPTYQRMAILETVAADRSHPTIRVLHGRLVRKIPTLSKTTLYSALELFARKGLVTPLLINPSEARFDGLLPAHHHFYCTSCGRILDLDLQCPNSRRGAIHGHRIDEVHGYFKGVCADCRAASFPRPRHSSHKIRGSLRA